jgi:hypothetical protein
MGDGAYSRADGGYAKFLEASKTESDIALTTSYQNILELDCRGLTGMKTFLILNTAATSILLQLWVNSRRNLKQDELPATNSVANGMHLETVETTITAGSSLKIDIVSSFHWMVLEMKGASGAESYYADFMGI